MDDVLSLSNRTWVNLRSSPVRGSRENTDNQGGNGKPKINSFYKRRHDNVRKAPALNASLSLTNTVNPQQFSDLNVEAFTDLLRFNFIYLLKTNFPLF